MSPPDRTPPHASPDRPEREALPRLAVLALAAITFSMIVGALLRERFDIAWTTDSLRILVDDSGAWAPVLFVALVAVRMVVMIPGALLLTAAGALFGTIDGSMYGAAGLTITALAAFGIVRSTGTDRLRGHVPERFLPLLDLGRSRAGVGWLALCSGYPVGPSVWAQAGAAASGMSILPFLFAVGAGSVVRAASFSYFGSTLVEGQGRLVAGLLFAALLALPLLHPQTRRALRSVRTRGSTPPTGGTACHREDQASKR